MCIEDAWLTAHQVNKLFYRKNPVVEFEFLYLSFFCLSHIMWAIYFQIVCAILLSKQTCRCVPRKKLGFLWVRYTLRILFESNNKQTNCVIMITSQFMKNIFNISNFWKMIVIIIQSSFFILRIYHIYDPLVLLTGIRIDFIQTIEFHSLPKGDKSFFNFIVFFWKILRDYQKFSSQKLNDPNFCMKFQWKSPKTHFIFLTSL